MDSILYNNGMKQSKSILDQDFRLVGNHIADYFNGSQWSLTQSGCHLLSRRLGNQPAAQQVSGGQRQQRRRWWRIHLQAESSGLWSFSHPVYARS